MYKLVCFKIVKQENSDVVDTNEVYPLVRVNWRKDLEDKVDICDTLSKSLNQEIKNNTNILKQIKDLSSNSTFTIDTSQEKIGYTNTNKDKKFLNFADSLDTLILKKDRDLDEFPLDNIYVIVLLYDYKYMGHIYSMVSDNDRIYTLFSDFELRRDLVRNAERIVYILILHEGVRLFSLENGSSYVAGKNYGEGKISPINPNREIPYNINTLFPLITDYDLTNIYSNKIPLAKDFSFIYFRKSRVDKRYNNREYIFTLRDGLREGESVTRSERFLKDFGKDFGKELITKVNYKDDYRDGKCLTEYGGGIVSDINYCNGYRNGFEYGYASETGLLRNIYCYQMGTEILSLRQYIY